MHPSRKIGHNILHLIYPIRVKNKNDHINKYFLENLDKWEPLYDDVEGADNQNQHEQNIPFNFPSTYSVEPFTSSEPNQKSLRHWIDNKELYSYFHPSVQRILFQENKKLQVFRKKNHEPRLLIGKFSRGYGDETLPSVPIEWMSSEVYLFSEESGFLVVRVSMLENVSIGDVIESHDTPIYSLDIWMKFLNRIRQNYQKYSAQPRLLVTENQDESPKLFFEHLEDGITEDMNVFVTGIDVELDGEQNIPDIRRRIEANCYVHAFAQSDLSLPLTLEEKYQMVLVDDYDGESGGDSRFKEDFIKDRIYSRWVPDTYYTAIDYGAVTIANCKTTCYKGQEPRYAFPDLLYQHHTRHYLFFMLLQLYYRDELQEIMGRYASLPNFEKNDNHTVKAKQILNSYYNLNQHFIFDRITHEIQGLEMWKFYQNVLGTKDLYKAVQEDMRELNQRLIEATSDLQNKEIRLLTIVSAITGMLGMNIFIDEVKDTESIRYLFHFLSIDTFYKYSSISFAVGLQLITLGVLGVIFYQFIYKDIFVKKILKRKRGK
jgi:hypothetical protein